MGKIINAYILPHPPVIVPGIGRGRERSAGPTVEAAKKVAREIALDRPTTVILSTPHAPGFRDFVYIYDQESLSGDFAAFGSPEIEYRFRNNKALYTAIAEKAAQAGINAGGLGSSMKKQYGISDRLDHGALVPLCFIQREWKDFRLICISTPFLPFEELYRFGRCIEEAVAESDERVVYIASGDLSHKLDRDAPAGYHPMGRKYDEYLVDKVRRNDVQGLIGTKEDFLEKAGECGTRSIIMMYGALHGRKTASEVYSYEGPFGVGYLIAKISPEDKAVQASSGEAGMTDQLEESMDRAPARLARETLEMYIRSGNKISVPGWVPAEMKNRRAGVFVSLKKKGELRGCIGTVGPTMVNIAEEIITNAISSGTRDPRFPTVKESELEDLTYSVDVLGPPEKISSMDELDIKRYGVIVTAGFRRGLLLPDLEGVDTPEQQVSIALQKSGINSGERFDLQRFEVIRYVDSD